MKDRDIIECIRRLLCVIAYENFVKKKQEVQKHALSVDQRTDSYEIVKNFSVNMSKYDAKHLI